MLILIHTNTPWVHSTFCLWSDALISKVLLWVFTQNMQRFPSRSGIAWRKSANATHFKLVLGLWHQNTKIIGCMCCKMAVFEHTAHRKINMQCLHHPPRWCSSYQAWSPLSCLLSPRWRSKPWWRASARTSAQSSSSAHVPFSTCNPEDKGRTWRMKTEKERWRRGKTTGQTLTLLRTLWYISRKTSSKARLKASALVTLSSRPAPMCSKKLHTDIPSTHPVASWDIKSSSGFPSHSWLIAVEIFLRRYSTWNAFKL